MKFGQFVPDVKSFYVNLHIKKFPGKKAVDKEFISIIILYYVTYLFILLFIILCANIRPSKLCILTNGGYFRGST